MLNSKHITRNIDLEALKKRGKIGRQLQHKFLSDAELVQLGVDTDEATSEKTVHNTIARTQSKLSSQDGLQDSFQRKGPELIISRTKSVNKKKKLDHSTALINLSR